MAKTKDSYATYLFHEGTNYQAYKLFSPTPQELDKKKGWAFSVWAPSARAVSVVGDFNEWNVLSNQMEKCDDGTWVLFIEGLKQFDNYKYAITDCNGKNRFQMRPLWTSF